MAPVRYPVHELPRRRRWTWVLRGFVLGLAPLIGVATIFGLMRLVSTW